MDSKSYKTILQTICYADIFDYPLKEEEVERFICHPQLVSGSPPRLFVPRQTRPQNDMRGDIKKANGIIQHKNHFMFLKGKEELLVMRQKREIISRQKLLIAKRIASILTFIPTIKLIGVSGSVAMKNASAKDDIDLFIVAREETVWLTRLLATVIVELFAKRRRPGDTDVADKICLNMFVGENYLAILKEKQNLYTAHEVCQLRVLYERDNTYQKFLIANLWVKKFLPNAIMAEGRGQRAEGKLKQEPFALRSTLYAAEWLAKHMQLWYMRKRRTREVVTNGYLAFHPKDYTEDILTAFRKRVAFYGSQV